jgi:hypothetical protein
MCQFSPSSSSLSLTSPPSSSLSLIFQNAVGPAGPCGSKSLSNHDPITPLSDLNPPTCTPSLRHLSSPLLVPSVTHQPLTTPHLPNLPVKDRNRLPPDLTIWREPYTSLDLGIRVRVPRRVHGLGSPGKVHDGERRVVKAGAWDDAGHGDVHGDVAGCFFGGEGWARLV